MIVTIENRLDKAVHVTINRTGERSVDITMSDVRRIGVVHDTIWYGRLHPKNAVRLRGFHEDDLFAAVAIGFSAREVITECYDGTHLPLATARLVLRYRDDGSDAVI